MLLRTSSSGEELELFVFLEEELGLRDLSLGAPIHEEMTAEQRGRLYEWLFANFQVEVERNQSQRKRPCLKKKVVRFQRTRARESVWR